MMMEKPKMEFVAIDLRGSLTTLGSTCNDGKTCDDGEAGGTLYCNTSNATQDCGTPQSITA